MCCSYNERDYTYAHSSRRQKKHGHHRNSFHGLTIRFYNLAVLLIDRIESLRSLSFSIRDHGRTESHKIDGVLYAVFHALDSQPAAF